MRDDCVEAVSYTHLDVYKRQGLGYVEKKLENKNKKMVDKLNKLIRKKEVKKEHLSKNNYEKRVINLTEVNFNTEEKEMLANGLKYGPPQELNQGKNHY